MMYLHLFSVADVDGDDVRCRWAEQFQGECAGVCRAISATLSGVKLYLHSNIVEQLVADADLDN